MRVIRVVFVILFLLAGWRSGPMPGAPVSQTMSKSRAQSRHPNEQTCGHPEEDMDEIPDPYLQQSGVEGDLERLLTRSARGRSSSIRSPAREHGGLGRVDRLRGPCGLVTRKACDIAGRAGHRHRRALRRGEGVPGRLLSPGLRQHGTRGRTGCPDTRRGSGARRGASDHGTRRVGPLIGPGEGGGRLSTLGPQILAALARRFGDFAVCEHAVQEALLAAALQWPVDGLPANPRGWLTVVASRRRAEMWRSDSARRRPGEASFAAAVPDVEPATDDSLTLLLLCCHPSLTPASQVALTLRAVGGLATAEIARALLVPETTVAQRISRAKQRIRASGARFRLPPEAERSERLAAVLHVLYLVFNEGSTASSGATLHRVDLIAEAIRITRQLHERLPDDGEVAGLLALMLLTDARRPARVAPDGALIPLADQDRALWDTAAIREGIDLITRALSSAPAGAVQQPAPPAAG